MRTLIGRCVLGVICVAVAGETASAAEERLAVVGARPGPGYELIELSRGLLPALLGAAFDQPLLVSEWPLAPGARARVELRRFDVYGEGARVVHEQGGSRVDVPRSPLRFFEGRSKSDPTVRVLIWLDPATRRLGGFADSRAGRHHLRSAHRRGRWVRVARDLEEPAARRAAANWRCGTEPGAEELEVLEQAATAPTTAAAPAITTLHFADIAVETDTELMALKFANNTTSATNYIAQLLASMSVMYERDLNVRLRQGFTILRTSAAGDPYTEPSDPNGLATFAQLTEFTNYWQANYPAGRTLAMMLSGKSPATNSASGVAWVDGLCSKSIGYAFIQVFRSPGSGAAADSKLVGHELGHVFGSLHSHCYHLDECFDCEACNDDGTLSCPAPQTMNGVANVRGTVMSYCHFDASPPGPPPQPCSVGGCTSSEVFHPTTVANVLNARVQDAATAPNQCIFPPPSPTRLFTIAPCRLIDTRSSAALPAGGEATFTIPANFCAIPAGTLSLSLNVTVPSAGGSGYLSLYPASITFPGTTTVNFSAGQTRANNAIIPLAPGLSFKVFNGAPVPVHVVVDVNGYFAVSP